MACAHRKLGGRRRIERKSPRSRSPKRKENSAMKTNILISTDVCVYGRDACSHRGGGCRKV